MSYSYSKNLDKSFDKAEESVRNVLSEIGFGILTEINVKKAFKEKLGITFKKYKILGACNPSLAFQALNDEEAIGLLLPCNVILWENKDNTTTIAAINANKMMTIVENEQLFDIAKKVDSLLQLAVDNL